MNFSETVEFLRQHDPDAVIEAVEDRGDPFVVLTASSLLSCAGALRDSQSTQLDQLSLVSGVDYLDRGEMEVVYHFDSINKATPFTVKVIVPRDDARVPSLCGLFDTADWHERETFDMFGIRFSGHPNLKRILMWDEYPYHPLRKEFPLAGIDVPLPAEDVAEVTKASVEPAPMMGGPFVSPPEGRVSEAEPRAKDESWTEEVEKPV